MARTNKRSAVLVIAAACAALIAVAVYAGASFYGLRAPQLTSAPGAVENNKAVLVSDPQSAQSARLTLNPKLYQGKVKQAYQVAERDPALLSQLHCYCGCDRTDNHKNLLDCFRDTHGSRCPICVGEAIDAEKLGAQGSPVDQIRDILRQRYSHGD